MWTARYAPKFRVPPRPSSVGRHQWGLGGAGQRLATVAPVALRLVSVAGYNARAPAPFRTTQSPCAQTMSVSFVRTSEPSIVRGKPLRCTARGAAAARPFNVQLALRCFPRLEGTRASSRQRRA